MRLLLGDNDDEGDIPDYGFCVFEGKNLVRTEDETAGHHYVEAVLLYPNGRKEILETELEVN